MLDDSAAILDDLLIRWHQTAFGRVGRGHDSKSAVFGQSQTSRQYDDVSGALDDDLDAARVRAVDFHVGEMADPHRSAIYANARALVHGCAVFSSPRLPQDREQRMAVVQEARQMLTRRLVAAGVL